MYRKISGNIWSGRTDAEDGPDGRRWHEVVRTIDLMGDALPVLERGTKGCVLLGFACDEGVRRNKGRAGASGGPDAIRSALSGLPDHFAPGASLWDCGDITCEDGDPEGAREELSRLVTTVLDHGYFPLILGGGHEVAWGTFRGIVNSEKAFGTTGIINLDAHFDLRKLPEDGASSGTPFYQMALWHGAHDRAFNYFVAGIQKMSNTRALFTRAAELGAQYITAEEIRNNPGAAIERLGHFIDRVDHLYLTVCLDVFNAAFAPGVSAPNPLGIQYQDVLRLLHLVRASEKMIAADIAEMNPLYDIDGRTARLSAALAFELLS